MPDLAHVHAVLHCNVNTRDWEAVQEFFVPFGFTERMRNVSDDSDGAPLGLPKVTSSHVTFIYDKRGPRAAPALEIIEWLDPATEPLIPAPSGRYLGFAAVGLRVDDLTPFAHLGEEVEGGIEVRGRFRPARRVQAPDNIVVELVQMPSGPDDRGVCHFSYLRLRSSGLKATKNWYGLLGWRPVHESDGTLSLIVDEDPTVSLEFVFAPDADPIAAHANTEGLYRMALAVEDVPAAVERLRAAGVQAPEPIFMPMLDVPTGGFTVAFLADPDGAVIEMVSRPRTEVRRPLLPA